MINKLIEIFLLKEYENIRKIQKNIFYKEDNFSKSYEKLFTKDVDSIYIISALNKNSINISNYKTEEHNYSEIYYLYVSLKSDKNITEINKIIHSIIPNPCIIILGYSDSIIISTATKRISKNDKTKQVIEDYFITDKIDLEYQTDIEKEFIKDISLINNSFENFRRFYTDISNKILIIKISNLRGGYKKTSLENIGKLLEYYNEYKKLNIELSSINTEYKNEISMGGKAIIYSKIVEKEKEIEKIKEDIKNI